jgi:hypothetical protein
MTWFKATSLTIANNSAVATVVSGEDISNIQAGDGLIVGAFTPVEIKRVYIDANNNRFIELVGAWLNATQTSVPSRVLPTSGDFAGAVQALKDATALLSNNFASLDSWYSAMGNVVLTSQNGTEYTARTFKQMDADVQAIQDNNQAIIDDSVSEKIAKIRYSKLDNPLCHLFKKNKLVDTLKGQLSWTRDGGATYINQYRKLQYSPSPYATNLLTYSEAFSDIYWSASRLTRVDNYGIAPDGTMTASIVTDNEIGSSVIYLNDGRLTLTPAENYTFSFYVKAVTTPCEVTIRLAAGQFAVNSQALFNLETGVFTSNSVNAVASYHKNGWWRLSIKGKAANAPAGTLTLVQLNEPDAVGTSCMIWGAQLEKSRVANGYVKTEGASASGRSYVGIDITRQEKEGWFIEGASTNNVLFSSAIETSNIGWNNSNSGTGIDSALTPNFAEAPDGSFSASRVQLDLAGGTKSEDQSGFWGSYNTIIGTTTTFSIWLKANVGSPTIRIDFNGSSPDNVSSNITLTDEWVRHVITSNSPFDTSRRAAIRLRGGQGTSDAADFLAWGGQEESLPLASSYIPTTDATATRSGDKISIPYEGNIPRGDQPFTFVFSGVIDGYTSYNRLFDTDSTDINTRLYVFLSGSGIIHMTNGVDTAIAVTTPISFGEYFTYIVTFDGVTFKSYLDGAFQASSLAVSPATALPNELRIMTGFNGTYNSYGTCSDFRVYDFPLNADEVAFLAGE